MNLLFPFQSANIFIAFFTILLNAQEIEDDRQDMETCEKRAVGYYSNYTNRTLDAEQLQLLTHLIYGDIAVGADARLHVNSRKSFDEFLQFRQQNLELKLLINLIESDFLIFDAIFANNQSRSLLCQNIVQFLQKYNLDGVNIDRGDNFDPAYYGNQDGKKLFKEFIIELSTHLGDQFLLTMTSPNTQHMGSHNSLRNGYDLPTLAQHVLFFNVKSFNYRRFDRAGPNAPLYEPNLAIKMGDFSANVAETIRYYACAIGNTKQINLGIPMFAVAYSNVSMEPLLGDGSLLYAKQKFEAPVEEIPYFEMVEKYDLDNVTTFDAHTRSSYFLTNGIYFAIENAQAIEERTIYGMNNGIGGYFLSNIDYDAANASILKSVHEYTAKCPENKNATFLCANGQQIPAFPVKPTFLKWLIVSLIVVIPFVGSISFFAYYCFGASKCNYKLVIEEAGEKKLELYVTINSGKFGIVRQAKWEERIVAAKVLKNRTTMVYNLKHERKILEELEAVPNEANVCKFLTSVLHQNQIVMLFEFAPLGDLQKYLDERKPQFTANNVAQLAAPPLLTMELVKIGRMVSKGLAYLFSKNIVHCDLAARNCLVFGEDDRGVYSAALRKPVCVKIADFGMAKIIPKGKSFVREVPIRFTVCTDERGNPSLQLLKLEMAIRWSAPEVLTQNMFSKKSDIWSFGILLHEIFTYGTQPFNDLADKDAVRDAILNDRLPKIPANAPEGIVECIKNCCKLDRAQRADIEWILLELENVDEAYEWY